MTLFTLLLVLAWERLFKLGRTLAVGSPSRSGVSAAASGFASADAGDDCRLDGDRLGAFCGCLTDCSSAW